MNGPIFWQCPWQVGIDDLGSAAGSLWMQKAGANWLSNSCGLANDLTKLSAAGLPI